MLRALQAIAAAWLATGQSFRWPAPWLSGLALLTALELVASRIWFAHHHRAATTPLKAKAEEGRLGRRKERKTPPVTPTASP